jgi:hypothetical protein
VRWERFFEDLEDQLDSEWEAERAALDSEAERLRVSRLALRERFVPLVARGDCDASLDLADGSVISGRLTAVGSEWVAVTAASRNCGATLVPLRAVIAVGLAHSDIISSARDGAAGSALHQRMTFAFALRDLARRRIPVTVQVGGGRGFVGTIDRAGADHLDIALHDAGAPRRADSVTGHRLISLAAIAWVRVESGQSGF